MSTNRTCPECGGPIPADARQGVCARCLLSLGLRERRPDQAVGDTLSAGAQTPVAVDAPADRLFEREWTWTLLDRVVSRLAAEYAQDGKGELFEALRGYLPRTDGALPYDQLGMALRMNTAAVRMAVHRLRRRYGELLRAEIAATVSDPELIDEEIRCLIDAASG